MPGDVIYVGEVAYWAVHNVGGRWYIAFLLSDTTRSLVYVEADEA
jgi:hypothetical protein